MARTERRKRDDAKWLLLLLLLWRPTLPVPSAPKRREKGKREPYGGKFGGAGATGKFD